MKQIIYLTFLVLTPSLALFACNSKHPSDHSVAVASPALTIHAVASVGTVIDAQTNRPIKGAIVTIDSSEVTLTNIDGVFAIKPSVKKIAARACSYSREEMGIASSPSQAAVEIKLQPIRPKALYLTVYGVSHRPRRILDKETVDEIIFNSRSVRDRLILELQARCGLRIGEVLNLRASDVSGRKLIIQEPKPGRDAEIAFMPEHIAARLAEYINSKQLSADDRVFPLCYTTMRNLVSGLGKKLDVKISPHDLRRHSATYASRNGVPLEIISKVILRHQDLKTTQVYLGKISDTEAIRWMDILHGK